MGGIFQSDAVLKEAVTLGLEDLRKNLWLIDHALGDFTDNQYLKDKFGINQINSCKEWFANNNINIYMGYRKDRMQTPCVTITLNPQSEKNDMKHMGDASTESVVLMPNQIGKPIPYVVKPFIPTGYDITDGLVSVSDSVDLGSVSAGMILVNPSNGEGYIIEDLSPEGIIIESGLSIEDGTEFGIVPQYQIYKARIEHTFMNASYSVICTAHGDPQNVLWLHDLVLYSLFRYRESLLEAQGLSETAISSGDLTVDPALSAPGAETAWERTISISGQIEQTFIKTPRRYIENATLREKAVDGYTGGIKILSNLDSPEFIEEENENWITIQDDGE